MPSYNRAEELKVMVDSIIASTFSAWELIIVDDGSEEETISLLQSYSQADSRIKLHPRKEVLKEHRPAATSVSHLPQEST